MTTSNMVHSQYTAAKMLFDDLTEATMPTAAQASLQNTLEVFGFVPNLAVAMSAEPPALEGYFHALHTFERTSLSPIEQQIVLMAVSQANEATYSVAVHATLALKLGTERHIVEAIGAGAPIADPKLEALRRFAETLMISGGRGPDADIELFLAAGYDRAAVVSVAFGIAVKTFANTIAHLARPKVDDAFAPAFAALREGFARSVPRHLHPE